ncbi:hypothetical protein Q3G72_006325 [Acer saccharum]|nr:hypothetical protein Q3G72_006325 [Acer saccharum]
MSLQSLPSTDQPPKLNDCFLFLCCRLSIPLPPLKNLILMRKHEKICHHSRKKGTIDDAEQPEQVGKSYAQAGELEKQLNEETQGQQKLRSEYS